MLPAVPLGGPRVTASWLVGQAGGPLGTDDVDVAGRVVGVPPVVAVPAVVCGEAVVAGAADG